MTFDSKWFGVISNEASQHRIDLHLDRLNDCMNSTMLVAMDDMIAEIANSTIVFGNELTLLFQRLFSYFFTL